MRNDVLLVCIRDTIGPKYQGSIRAIFNFLKQVPKCDNEIETESARYLNLLIKTVGLID